MISLRSHFRLQDPMQDRIPARIPRPSRCGSAAGARQPRVGPHTPARAEPRPTILKLRPKPWNSRPRPSRCGSAAGARHPRVGPHTPARAEPRPTTRLKPRAESYQPLRGEEPSPP
jgi:hypothetical protein